MSGLERLREAWRLLNGELFGGSIYLGGRAVECLLRALIWKHDNEIRAGRRSLDTGRDLRELLSLVTNLGVLREYEHRHAFARDVQRVGRLA